MALKIKAQMFLRTCFEGQSQVTLCGEKWSDRNVCSALKLFQEDCDKQ